MIATWEAALIGLIAAPLYLVVAAKIVKLVPFYFNNERCYIVFITICAYTKYTIIYVDRPLRIYIYRFNLEKGSDCFRPKMSLKTKIELT